MKNIFYKNILLIGAILLLMLSCTKTEWDDISDIKPGFGVINTSSDYEVTLTKDLSSDTIDYSDLSIELVYFFNTKIMDVSKAGFLKIIMDENGEYVETVADTSFTDLSDTIRININTKKKLFENMAFHPDSIRSGFAFIFKPYLISGDNDTTFAAYGDYVVSPEYVNFCDLPEIPLGIYEAHNKATGFKKDVEILWMEVSPDVWFYVITDFGLDWNGWDDFWYGTNFSLACPLPGDSRFVVELSGWGIDMGGTVLEMENDDGVLESRPLRIMPWVYDSESPDVGYYDEVAMQFTFKNVQVLDTWWNIDNHLIEEVTFTYKGE